MLECDEPKRLAYSFRQEGVYEHYTRVAIDLEPIDGGVRLRLVHDELADPGDVAGWRQGWTPIINNLKEFLHS